MRLPDPILEKEFPVRHYELDSRGNVRPVTLLNYLQDTAGLHAAHLGVAMSDLRKSGLTWVLSRVHMLIAQYPRAEETVTVRTWPSTRQGLFSFREFEMTGNRGTHYVKATTSWAALNLRTRRPVKLEGHLPDYPLLPHRVIDDDFSSLPLFSDPATRELPFRVLRSDLDSNHHVTNTVFAQWALEAVPDEVAANWLTELEIAFRTETFYGETILSRCFAAQGDQCLHQIVNRETGRELARGRTRFEKTGGKT